MKRTNKINKATINKKEAKSKVEKWRRDELNERILEMSASERALKK
jgi:hypothetical protein